MNIQRLRVNHIINPLGFDLGNPTFSWEVANASGTRAEASRIVVMSDGKGLADTGWADLDNACATIGRLSELLVPRTRYEWRVSVRSDSGEEATSEVAWFETGKMDEPWDGAWITCDSSESRHPIFCSEVALDESKEVASARLYICGLGLYDAYIGGVHVGEEYLAPGTHAYDKWLQVATHDVSDLLHDSTRLEVRMGNGWWKGRFGFIPMDKGFYGDGWREVFQFGDWLALDGPKGERTGGTDEGFISDLYFWRSACIVRDAARVLGDRASEGRYAALANRLATWIEYEYFSASGRCVVNTQTAYTLAIVSGFGSTEFSARALAKLLARNDGKLATGFVGTAFLNRALSETGLTREAFDLLLNEEYPGWLYCVKLGATTIWERWNSLDENGHITGIDMNSMNHYSYGAIVEWLYAYVAGLRYVREEPGFRRAIVAPTPNWRLGSVSCDYHASVGAWHVGWRCVDETHLHVELTVPFGCTAEVTLPLADGSAYEELGGHVLATGTYELTYETTEPLRRMPTVDWPLARLMGQPDTAAVVSRHCYHPEFLLNDSEKSTMSVRELAPSFARGGGPMSAEALDACEADLRSLWE